MSNTLTNTDAEILVNKVLPAFKAGMAPLNAFSTNFDAEVAQESASIQVPVITAKTANTGGFTTYADGDSTVVGVQVLLNNRPRSFSHLTDLEAGKTPMAIIEAQAIEDAKAVALSCFQTVIGLFVAGTYGDVANTSKLVVTSANWDADDLAELSKLLKKRDALGPMSLIQDLDYAGGLAKDNALQVASALGSTQMIRNGAMGSVPLLGVSVYETNAFPSALTNENTGAILAVPSAVAVASRPIYPQEGAAAAGTTFAVATDEETGLSLGHRSFYDNATGTFWHGCEVLLGCLAVQSAGAVRAVSA